MNSHESVVKRGYDAHYASRPRNSNPYHGSSYRRDWFKGYDAATQEMLKARSLSIKRAYKAKNPTKRMSIELLTKEVKRLKDELWKFKKDFEIHEARQKEYEEKNKRVRR